MNKWARFVVTFFMLVLCSAMAFAGNFSISNSTDANFYDQNGKKLSETKEVMDNYIIRTNEEEVTLVGDLGSVTIGKNSLFSLGDLSSESPYFYLIDGSMEVSLNPSCEGSVYTAVMQYFLQKGTIASFVATDEEESCMVKGGMVVATNGITGNMVKLTYVVEEPKTATVEEVIEPVVEVETVEEVAPVAPLSPLYEEFDIYGQKATITAYVGEAHITVPDFVTENDINTAAAAAMAYYAPYLQGIFYSFEDGYIKVTYPESYGPQEFEFASSILKVELPAYLNLLSSQYISNSVDVVKETTTEEVVAEETIVEETIIEEVIEESATEEFDVEISEETVVETVIEESVDVETVVITEEQTYEEASDVEIKTVETVAEPVVEPVSKQPTEKVKKEKQPFKSGFTATVYYGDCGKDLDKSITKSIRSLKIKAGITDNIYGAYDPYITNGTFIAKAHFGFSTDKGFDDLSLILGLNTNIIDITAGASISQKLVLGAQGSLGFNFGKYVNLTFDGIAKYDLFTSNLNSYGAMATLSLSKNSFYGAIGASYNVAENLFGPTVAVSRNRVGSYVLDNGTSPIVDLYGALSLSGKHLSMNINGYMPINLNVFDNSYYSIGSASLSADQFNGSISLKFKGLTFTAGGQYNGLVGKAVKLVRNIKDTSAVKANIKNILRFTDSMLYFSGELKLGNYVSVFGTMSYTNENLHNHSLDVKAGAKITI